MKNMNNRFFVRIEVRLGIHTIMQAGDKIMTYKIQT
jgi:hypothetical protein